MKKLVVANFKSNKSVREAQEWFEGFSQSVSDAVFTQLSVSIAPSFTALSTLSQGIQQNTLPCLLAAQDISPFSAGSYTGATSGQNLQDLGVKQVIVGHSERRNYFDETSQDVALKIEQAVLEGLTPIICVDLPYLDEQLALIDSAVLAKCIIAYEPLSAIGSGKNADLGNVKMAIEKIKRLASESPIIYGGSVSDQNVKEYLIVTDGVLVGTKSLDYLQFVDLLNACLLSP